MRLRLLKPPFTALPKLINVLPCRAAQSTGVAPLRFENLLRRRFGNLSRRTAMIIARWSIDARFGHKQTVLDSMIQWEKDVASKIGWTDMRLLTGSIGARESTVQSEVRLNDLAELNAAWDKLATIESHKRWSKELEPYIVSGTPRWEIFRVVSEGK
jgi:hypothetical protein